MPPKKRKAAGSATAASRLRRSTRQSARNNDTNSIPDVYQEMLIEAAGDVDANEGFVSSPRSHKRRKVSIDQGNDVDDLFDSPPAPTPEPAESQPIPDTQDRPQQVVYDDFEGSDESDVEFEDVELEAAALSASEDESLPPKSFQIDLSKSALETPKRNIQRRKPVTKEEREMRLDVHKWHLLSLIGHGVQRNSWCNDQDVHAILKPLIPRKLVKLLHSNESKPQYERNRSFTKGVEEICTLWRQQWKTTTHGLKRAYWREGVDARDEVDEGEDIDLEDFKTAARTCRGSRDLGAQLFTALLRSIAVDARLVFSPQVLPFTGAAKAETPFKSQGNPNYIYAPTQNYGVSASGSSPFTAPSKRPKKSKKILESAYPIFWTEILTPSHIWTPLDPIVRNSISKPKTQFEPPLSDNFNSMTYVIAYEEDNSARDVTRRYTQWYNAKTRKLRVESTKNGEQWYKSALSVLYKKLYEPRDAIEDGELAQRANTEGMPHNIQDFKNHPVYVLERHMRVNEVLEPKREVGKVNVGTTKNGKLESVYRRQDVHLCRTADAWYRRGRDVKTGEQPLKYAIPKSRKGGRGISVGLSGDEDQDEDGVGLYAEYQTNLYEPPPVVNGRIPKNAYGNLDIYVPSMIPPGAVHVCHTLSATAAKTLAIDFADAVTGFDFKGRQGTAIINGIVVAEQFAAAVATVISGLEALGSEEVQQARSKILLGLWKRMIQALRVRERVEAEYGSSNPSRREADQKGNEDEDENEAENDSPYRDSETASDVGGGFMLEDQPTEEKMQEQAVSLQALKAKIPTVLPEEIVSIPIEITRSPHKLPIKHTDGDQYATMGNNRSDDELFEDNNPLADTAGGFVPEGVDTEAGGGFMPEDNRTDQAGGFLPEDETETGGGFLVEDQSPPPTNPASTKTTPMPRRSRNDTSNSSVTANSPHDMDLIHSDAEEDTALQIAIAQSLATEHSKFGTGTELDDTQLEPDTIKSQPSDQPPNQATNTIEDSDSATGLNSHAPSSSSSSTSLLSHDPDEDDEEPEWLNEALEE